MKRRRIVLLNGALGQWNRLVIRGRIADWKTSPETAAKEFDPFLALPPDESDRIKPVTDISLRKVPFPEIIIEIINHSGRGNPSHEELLQAEVIYRSKAFRADASGYFSHSLEHRVQPGHYSIRVLWRDHKNYVRHFKDIAESGYLRSKTDHENYCILGYGKIRILPDDYTGRILTSDIDQTFLDTDIQTKKGLIGTLFETPSQKRPLPGMDAFYRDLRAKDKDPLPLIFLSASPHFFRRTFQVRFRDLGIDYTGLSLKHFSGILDPLFEEILKNLKSPGDLISWRIGELIERSSRYFRSEIDGLFNQVSYKLIILLENRLMQPTGAREILMGDNTESDFLTFALYQLFLSGRLSYREIETLARRLRFRDKKAVSGVHLGVIMKLIKNNLITHGRLNPVEHVWINQAYSEPGAGEIIRILEGVLPEKITESERIISRLAVCKGAEGFRKEASEAGLIDL